MVVLRGMTWDHARGHAPLVAASTAFGERNPGVTIRWDRRSLQDFEHFPVQTLARDYDLIVMDHPHVGQLADGGALLPLDGRDDAALDALAQASVGPSFESYRWHGHLWALPIDAAAQVQAWRPDLLAAPVRDWGQVLALAAKGRVLLPLRAPHALMSFFTLAANAGTPCAVQPGPLLPPGAGAATLERLRRIADLVDPRCFALDPIAALDLMAEADDWSLIPLVYGYVPYAQPGFRRRLVKFADIPRLGPAGVAGSALGGTGLAVSASSAAPDVAAAFAFFAASEAVQKTLYAAHSGQPGHRAAWLDPAVNAASADFYLETFATLSQAWLRPRHAGYIGFQHAGSQILDGFLHGDLSTASALRDLDDAFDASFAEGAAAG